MGRSKKKSEIPRYLYGDDAFSPFGMVTSNLLKNGNFQDVSYAGRYFYLCCAVHKQTTEQSHCLYCSLKEYYNLLGEHREEIDLQAEAGQTPKSRLTSMKFVFPESHLKEYGFTKSYASKLKQELIDKGFIKIFANEKKHSRNGEQGANRDNSKRVTIYEFTTSDWKKLI